MRKQLVLTLAILLSAALIIVAAVLTGAHTDGPAPDPNAPVLAAEAY